MHSLQAFELKKVQVASEIYQFILSEIMYEKDHFNLKWFYLVDENGIWFNLFHL